MATEVLVTLIFDPYGIYTLDGTRVSSVRDETLAFRKINETLRRDPALETVRPMTFVLDAPCWEHFQTYRSVKGVRLVRVTPRSDFCDRFGSDPPDWLTDDCICEWGLLTRDGPTSLVNDDWEATIASWFIPGLAEVTSFEQWLEVVASADFFPEHSEIGPVRSWIQEEFATLAGKAIASEAVVADMRSELRGSSSPICFAGELLRRAALLPLSRHQREKTLYCADLEPASPRVLRLAEHIPLVFPLPGRLQEEVSEIVRRAIHRARIECPGRFEATVLSLNALWSGVPEELVTWLELEPRSMTSQAADHLSRLPGFEGSDSARRAVAEYSPPVTVPCWHGISEDFDKWVNTYGSYIRASFVRRLLPDSENDPAASFGRWMKDNYTVSFEHAERGYPAVARRIQQSLASQRVVIVVLVDALAIHVVADATGYMTDYLDQPPSSSTYVFAPLPTITEVCKQAVLTGWLPDQLSGSLASMLTKRYGLSNEQVLLAANWQDAERAKVTPQTRLVVYRDNRLDDRLSQVKSYRSLLGDCADVFPRLSRMVGRWASDLRMINDSAPLVILTSDHGFTYGPPPHSDSDGPAKLDASQRCVRLTDSSDADSLGSDSMTVIRGETFHLRNDYLAARGRCIGTGTMSGWVLSHGGLLPEEVIIPIVEWFGEEVAVPWPEIVFPEGATLDQDRWSIPVVLRNSHAVPIVGGDIEISVAGESIERPVGFDELRPGAEKRLTATVPVSESSDPEQLDVQARVSLRLKGDSRIRSRQERHIVPRTRQLVERTAAQAAFEEMF